MRKGVYPYKYMNDLKRFSETVFPRKEDFYSNLNMDSDYNYAKRVCEGFKIKTLANIKTCILKASNTLLLADIFENLTKTCLEIYELDPAKICFSSMISMASNFKKG